MFTSFNWTSKPRKKLERVFILRKVITVQVADYSRNLTFFRVKSTLKITQGHLCLKVLIPTLCPKCWFWGRAQSQRGKFGPSHSECINWVWHFKFPCNSWSSRLRQLHPDYCWIVFQVQQKYCKTFDSSEYKCFWIVRDNSTPLAPKLDFSAVIEASNFRLKYPLKR